MNIKVETKISFWNVPKWIQISKDMCKRAFDRIFEVWGEGVFLVLLKTATTSKI